MDKRAAKHAKAFRKAATCAGIADVDACVESFERRLEGMYTSELFRTHDTYPTIDVELVYAVIAMCLELRGRGLSDALILDSVEQAYAGKRRAFSLLLGAIDLLPCSYAIVRRWNVSDHKMRVADGSIDYDLFEVRGHSIEYRISGCRYVDMFDAWGVRPLCKAFCETDTRSYACLTRHVDFVRHEDLSDGNSCHDEIFERSLRSPMDSATGAHARSFLSAIPCNERKPAMGKPAFELLKAKKFDLLIVMLCDRFGTDGAAEIWVDAERRLEGFLATTAQLSDGERMHAEGFVYPMCALFLAIAERCDREEARQICADFMRDTARKKGYALRRLLCAPGMRTLFMRCFGFLGSRLFGETAGFEQRMYECTASRLRMDILSCPYLHHCIAAGAPEVAPLFCANDDYVYGDLPGIAFRRAGTLARGADRCDFELVRESTE